MLSTSNGKFIFKDSNIDGSVEVCDDSGKFSGAKYLITVSGDVDVVKLNYGENVRKGLFREVNTKVLTDGEVIVCDVDDDHSSVEIDDEAYKSLTDIAYFGDIESLYFEPANVAVYKDVKRKKYVVSAAGDVRIYRVGVEKGN